MAGQGVSEGACQRINDATGVVTIRRPAAVDLEGLARWEVNWVAQPACFFSRNAWLKCGPLEESLHYGMDYDLWLKIAREFPIEKVQEVLSAGRIHPDAKTQADSARMFVTQWLIQIRHGFESEATEQMHQWMDEYLRLKRRHRRGSLARRVLRRLRSKFLLRPSPRSSSPGIPPGAVQ